MKAKARRQSKVRRAAPASADDAPATPPPSPSPQTSPLSPATTADTPRKVPKSAPQERSASKAGAASTQSTQSTKSKEADQAGAPRPRWQTWKLAAIVLVVLLAAGAMLLLRPGGASGSPVRHPCECAASAAAASRLAKAVLSRRSGVSGVHWRTGYGDLDFVGGCAGGAVVKLPDTFASVDDLRAALVAPFQKRDIRCVVWVTTPEAIAAVANALKQLMENNALGGRPVVPEQSRATLVLKTAQTREQLKAKLPHRVVHMLTEA